MAAVRMTQLAPKRWMCTGQQSTWRSDALLTFLRASGSLRAGAFIIGLGLEGA